MSVLFAICRLSAIVSSLPLEPMQKGWGYQGKMNFGVEVLVPVQYVMEHPPYLRVKYLLWLVEVIQQRKKQYT